ncbi:MAG: YjbH domain-containing protein [Ramlibacter sp.]|nr:YjbH domain-containing protein [Ramlibacter sp.]
MGISTQGVTGGLIVPSAYVLPEGDVALTRGNYAEPQLGAFSQRRNYSLGIGLLPNVELFGRFADFQNPLPGSTINGPRDLSANIKLKLPSFWRGQPHVALGLNDISGGASFFKSKYAVVSDEIGPVRWSAGYALGSHIVGNSANGYAFNGAFGGVEWSLGQSGVSLLAEYDGQQKHAGIRYSSPELAFLGHARLVATLQRSSGATNNAGLPASRTSAALSLVMPLEANARRPASFKPDLALAPMEVGPGTAPGMIPTSEDRQESLLRALVSAGFERVRVGVWGNSLLVEYENHRYEQTEADAIGLVLGLAAENAPSGVRRISAVTFKSGLRQYETSVDVSVYRAFLRDGDASQARTSLATDRFPDYPEAEVHWLSPQPTRRTPVRVEIKPDINYTVGTEVGAFDYSLAANVQGILPLWRGAELYTSYIRRVSNSDNYEPGFAFSGSRQRNGLKVAAVQQSFWLGSQVFANVGVGRYNYDAYGVQGEASLFVPGGDDVIRLRAGAYQRQPGQTNAQRLQASGSYRWAYSPSTWLEAGLQQYSDGTRGPSFVLTRWFGDVGAHLFFRKGGNRQFAGLEISIPLTPRKGMEPGFIQFTGTPQFQRGIRTRITGGSTATNNVEPNAVRDMQLDYNAELRQLNAGRTSQRYFISQLHRMREAFYLYGRDLLPR